MTATANDAIVQGTSKWRVSVAGKVSSSVWLSNCQATLKQILAIQFRLKNNKELDELVESIIDNLKYDPDNWTAIKEDNGYHEIVEWVRTLDWSSRY